MKRGGSPVLRGANLEAESENIRGRFGLSQLWCQEGGAKDERKLGLCWSSDETGEVASNKMFSKSCVSWDCVEI